MSDQYPTAIYRNKLLLPQYMRSENKVTDNIIDVNVESDWLLYLYINKLDEEIFSEPPDGLGSGGEAFWMDDRWYDLMPKLVDESRKHSWCVLQFYQEEPIWRIFTVASFSDWIKEEVVDDEGNKSIKRIGVKFQWSDDLGNVGADECIFDEGDCFLVKFKEGDGRNVFAYSDIPDALLDIVYNARQVKGQMDFIGSKPGFKHLIYGDSANETNITDLDTQLKNTDVASGVGAPKRILEDIVSVTDENTKVVLPIFDKTLEIFSGITRLPVSFYLGERSSGGLGENAEKTDLLKIDRKKNALFKRYEPIIQRIFLEHYGISLGNLEIKQDETLDLVETEGDTNYEQNSQGQDSKPQVN